VTEHDALHAGSTSIAADTSPVKAPVSSACMFWAATSTPEPCNNSMQVSSAVNGTQRPTSAGRREASGKSVSRRRQYSVAWARVPHSFQLPAM